MDNQETKEKSQDRKGKNEIKKLSESKLIKFYLKKKALKIKVIGSVLLLMINISCKTTSSNVIDRKTSKVLPYVFLENNIEYETNTSYLDFTLLNTSSKEITSFEVVVKLKEAEYESEITNDFTSEIKTEHDYENSLYKTFEHRLLPSEECEFSISLEDFFLDSEKEFEIELIYVSEIHFSDGSIWKDYSGVYAF